MATAEQSEQTKPITPDILSSSQDVRPLVIHSSLCCPPYPTLSIFLCDSLPHFPSIPDPSTVPSRVPIILPWLIKCYLLSTSSLKIILPLGLTEIQLSTKTSASPAALSFEAVPSHTSVLGGGSTFSLIFLPTFKYTAPLPSYEIPTPSQLMPSCHTPLYYRYLHVT